MIFVVHKVLRYTAVTGSVRGPPPSPRADIHVRDNVRRDRDNEISDSSRKLFLRFSISKYRFYYYRYLRIIFATREMRNFSVHLGET